jgi:hypothetical protein
LVSDRYVDGTKRTELRWRKPQPSETLLDGKDSTTWMRRKLLHCGTSTPPMSTWDHKSGDPKALGLTIPETLLATADEVIK